MKATVNGITVEGTPQEIMEYRKLVEEQALNTWRKQFGTGSPPWTLMPKVTSGYCTLRCEGQCFCTGACVGGAVTTSKIADYSITTESIKKYTGL